MNRGKTIRFKNPLRIKQNLLKFKFFRIFNLLLLLGILGSLYFFIFSNFYNITNIEVIGNKIITTDDLLDITHNCLNSSRLLIFRNKNIFVFDRNLLKEKINEKVVTENIKIEKILPNTLRITLAEKPEALKWLTSDTEYLVDGNGTIIKQFYKKNTPKLFQLETDTNQNIIPKEAEDDFIKINNSANQLVKLNDRVLNPEDVTFILGLNKGLNNLNYLKVTKLIVPNNLPQFIEVDLSAGGKIYFNIFDSIDKQISRLQLLMDKEIKKENLAAIDYIDLRLGENTYILRKQSNTK